MMKETPTGLHKVACTDCIKNKWMIPVCFLSLKSASSFEDKIGQNEKNNGSLWRKQIVVDCTLNVSLKSSCLVK